MDEEMDLMLQRKSFVLETGEQEYQTPKAQVAFREEAVQEKSFRQMMSEGGSQIEMPNISLSAIANNIKENAKEMEIPRQKGRIFMSRYVAEG